jgi:DNA-binding NarL/FixJ family response regulator
MATTLLIVDDHAGFRAFARALLEAEGFVVVGEAETGEAALRAAEAFRPEIVLVDIVLPDFDGFALCALLTAGVKPPVVVLTSSRDASTYRRRLGASRARGFIPKSRLTGAAIAAFV